VLYGIAPRAFSLVKAKAKNLFDHWPWSIITSRLLLQWGLEKEKRIEKGTEKRKSSEGRKERTEGACGKKRKKECK
jgi:hypothetical protein